MTEGRNRKREALRAAERQQANAELCGVELAVWLALPRTRRKELIRQAKEARRG
jgi:hypothetical protein